MTTGSAQPASNEPMAGAARPITVVIVGEHGRDQPLKTLVVGFARIAIQGLRSERVESDPMDLARAS